MCHMHVRAWYYVHEREMCFYIVACISMLSSRIYGCCADQIRYDPSCAASVDGEEQSIRGGLKESDGWKFVSPKNCQARAG
jgi:hypothetical protein